jgi:hypothetical protein
MLAIFFRVLLGLAVVGQIAFSKLVREEVVLTWEVAAPNGQFREVIKINGQLPGPAFRWDEDDDIEVRSSLIGMTIEATTAIIPYEIVCDRRANERLPIGHCS